MGLLALLSWKCTCRVVEPAPELAIVALPPMGGIPSAGGLVAPPQVLGAAGDCVDPAVGDCVDPTGGD